MGAENVSAGEQFHSPNAILSRVCVHLFLLWFGDEAPLVPAMLQQEISTMGVEARQALETLYNDVPKLDPLTQILYLDTRSNLPDDLLMVGDKMSMANSLEARVPFLDCRLVEFAESLQPELRLRRLTGKYLHQRAIESSLPKKVVYRKKKGFSNPVGHWFQNGMRAYLRDCLLSDTSARGRYFDRNYIRQM